MTKQLLSFAAITAAATLTSSAAVTWIGGTSADWRDDLNWDFTSSSLTAIDTGVVIADDIVIGNVGTAPSSITNFLMGDTFTLTVTNTTFGANVAGDSAATSSPGAYTLVNSAHTGTFIATGTNLSADATSTITLTGGGNPINGSTIDLAVGAQIFLTNEVVGQAEGHANSKIFVGGVAADYGIGGNLTIVSDGVSGSILTAVPVPEPSTGALLGLAGLALILRRRK